MGASWGHDGAMMGPWLRPGDRNAPRQLHPQAGDDRQRQTARKGVRADRWRRAATGGAAVWQQDLTLPYHLNGKREKVTIGAYPAFTIKQARDHHEELRALVERGHSPAKAKRVLSSEQKLADARRLTFRTFAQRWVDETLFYRSGGYVAQTVR